MAILTHAISELKYSLLLLIITMSVYISNYIG